MTRLPALAATAAAALLVLTACAQSAPQASTSAPATASASTGSGKQVAGSITVSAAASLNQVFPALAKQFEARYQDTSIEFSFGGSSTLAAQIVSGAPVDVFAAASTKTMATVTDAGLATGTPVVVARNRLEIAVPKGNPGGITGLQDFADASKTIVVCAKEVPCGAAAQQVFDLGKVAAKPDSYEPDVTSVLTKVRSGDADAGLVYVTDVQAAGDEVEGIPFSESDQAITDYPIVALKDSKSPALAAAWVDWVAANEDALQAAGFLAPQ